MRTYIFEFNLETGEVSEDTMPNYAVRYYQSTNGVTVEIGDGYRHNLHLKAEHWNRILKIIKNSELDKSGIQAITRGLMESGLPEEYETVFISAIKKEIIKEINEHSHESKD